MSKSLHEKYGKESIGVLQGIMKAQVKSTLPDFIVELNHNETDEIDNHFNNHCHFLNTKTHQEITVGLCDMNGFNQGLKFCS